MTMTTLTTSLAGLLSMWRSNKNEKCVEKNEKGVRKKRKRRSPIVKLSNIFGI
jgi:hypothetical protein